MRLAEDARVRWLATGAGVFFSVLRLDAVQEVDVFEVGGAEALYEFAADGAEKLDGGGGLEACEDADGDAGDADELAGLDGDDIGGAGSIIHKRDFAKEIAGLEQGEFHAFVGGRGMN